MTCCASCLFRIQSVPAPVLAVTALSASVLSLTSFSAASEAIAAGRLLTPAGTPPVHVLLHTRVSAAGLELRVKTADAGLSAALLAGITARLR